MFVCLFGFVLLSLVFFGHEAPKAIWRENGSFCLLFHIIVHNQMQSGQELKQGRHVAAGAAAEAVEGSCLLTRSSWLAQPALQ